MKHRNRVMAAIYARVSCEQQSREQTIASQVEALKARVARDGLALEEELCFVDDGYSGGTLVRPALERLRDQAAAGAVDRLYVHCPDRLARKYAYQVVLIDELRRQGIEVVFLNRAIAETAEDDLLLQVQGMIAEYERVKVLERSRRGKRHAALRGSVSVLGGAPYGYRYISKREGDGEARYEVVPEEAEVVRRIFEWVGRERCSIGEVCRRLTRQGVPTRRGILAWDPTTVWGMLGNPAYTGAAAYGKTRVGPRRPRARPRRGQPEQPRRPESLYVSDAGERVTIPVPAIVDEAPFAAIGAQLAEDRRRNRKSAEGARFLLSGLIACERCGYAFHGRMVRRPSRPGPVRAYGYYRCGGTDGHRFGGQRVCDARQLRVDLLEAAVWDDLRALLSQPERVRHEYERRLEAGPAGGPSGGGPRAGLIDRIRRGIARLIDAYEVGLLEKGEFEPRIRRARERLARLEEEGRAEAEREAEAADLRPAIGRLEEFAGRVSEGLETADWEARRRIVQAPIKKVEVDEEEVEIVYRIPPSPFAEGLPRGFMQDRGRRDYGPRGCPEKSSG